MNFKPVEMQIAMPRTTDMSQIAQHVQHKPANDQQHVVQSALKQAEVQRSSTEKTEQTAETAIRDSQSGARQSGRQDRRGSKRTGKTEGDTVSHPYKGKHIDLTL